MGLVARRRVILPYETWSNMFVAAKSRYFEALTLAVSEAGQEAGAIYLLGYAAEMLIKTACCQFNNLPNSSGIYQVLSSSFRIYSRSTGAPGQNLHSLTGLANFLIDTRFANGQPMSAAIAGALVIHIGIIAQHWEVDVRYYDFPATPEEVNETLESVDWLFENYQDLWSWSDALPKNYPSRNQA